MYRAYWRCGGWWRAAASCGGGCCSGTCGKRVCWPTSRCCCPRCCWGTAAAAEAVTLAVAVAAGGARGVERLKCDIAPLSATQLVALLHEAGADDGWEMARG